MIDIHSHLISGINHGPSSMEDSLRMLQEAVKAGVRSIIATPHIKNWTPEEDKTTRDFKKLSELSLKTGITLKRGYEVAVSPINDDDERNLRKLTLGGSRYLLMEFPLNNLPVYTDDVIFKLQLNGICPVIAHPERNSFFTGDPGLLMDLADKGCLIQIDAASIIGRNGRRAKGLCKKLIKMKAVNFVASDAHGGKDYGECFKKALDKVKKWAGSEYLDKIVIENPKKIMDDVDFWSGSKDSRKKKIQSRMAI